MRFMIVALLALLPSVAHANNLHAAESCGEAPAIARTDISEGVRNAALADADTYAYRLSELAAKAQETIRNLRAIYAISDDLLKRNYFATLCQRLRGKGIAAETLNPGLTGVAQALDLPAPEGAASTT